MNEITQLTRACGRALDANLRSAALLSELAARSMQLLASAVSEIGSQVITRTSAAPEVGIDSSAASMTAPSSSPEALVLEGVAGSRAFGLFVVENKLSKEVSTGVAVGPLVDPDGHEIKSVLRFEPGVITLAPGQQVIARVSARISRGLVAGVRYQAEISIPGISGARIPIIVRRKQTPKAAAVVNEASHLNADATRENAQFPDSHHLPGLLAP